MSNRTIERGSRPVWPSGRSISSKTPLVLILLVKARMGGDSSVSWQSAGSRIPRRPCCRRSLCMVEVTSGALVRRRSLRKNGAKPSEWCEQNAAASASLCIAMAYAWRGRQAVGPAIRRLFPRRNTAAVLPHTSRPASTCSAAAYDLLTGRNTAPFQDIRPSARMVSSRQRGRIGPAPEALRTRRYKQRQNTKG